MIGTRNIGLPLSDNVQKVYQPRGRRKVFVGTLDVDQALYQWAPSRAGGSIKNMMWKGSLSLGQEEWEQVQAVATKFEFKDATTMLLYRTTIDRIRRSGAGLEETPNGIRFLIPLECFRVFDAKTMKEIVK